MHGQSTTDDKASPKGNIREVLKPNEEGFHHQSEIKRISWWTKTLVPVTYIQRKNEYYSLIASLGTRDTQKAYAGYVFRKMIRS